MKHLLWQSDLGDGTYKNPILFADYSDPDVIRVGDTYFLTASSFNYVPGLPILVSKDLVNWKLVNYAIKNLPYEAYDRPAHAKGVWAPSIRYHNCEYWIFVGFPDEGIFMLHTKDPLGEWSEPICVREAKGFIDPCPFWDEDGKAYVIHAYAKSRIGFKSKLGIFPMSPDGTTCIGEDTFIYDGTKTQPTIEGPKVLKRDGYYYIFAPAGGVKPGWQTVLRSKNLYGPYEEKIVMHQGNTTTNGPHQGGLVDTPTGEEWFIHFQDAGVYGRICHLQPVIWENGWPIIGIDREGNGTGEPVYTYKKPAGNPEVTPIYLEASDDFNKNTLELQWQWQANYKDNFYSLKENPGHLRLFNRNPLKEINPLIWDSANVLTQKIVCPEFKASTKMIVSHLDSNSNAGLLMLGGAYAYLAIHKEDSKLQLIYVESDEVDNVYSENTLSTIDVDSDLNEIYLSLTFKDGTCSFSYSFDNTSYTELPMKFTPNDHQWVGAKIGLFSLAMDTKETNGYADFSYFTVDSVESL
ncbi:MAG: glycosyl hydrolase 43 family protein [Clostridiales bacterium]|nr:glycosyl hydrolase 43 family protein [Clostridiales bacterium]